MRPGGQVRRMVRTCISTILIIGQVFTLAYLPTATPARTANDDAFALIARAQRAARLVDEGLDRARYQPEALARAFSDWGQAFAYVRDEMALLPYPGLRRFADGTLAARGGNACDRSLLLAELLRAMGQQVRFARARLGAEAVEAMLGAVQATAGRAWRPGLDDPALLLPFSAARASGMPPEVVAEAEEFAVNGRQQLADVIAGDFLYAEERLGAVFRPAGEPRTEAAIREALADHCWVQLRTDGGWLDLDPSLPDALPGSRLAEAQAVFDDLPDGLSSTIGVRLQLSRRENGELRTETLLDETLRPASGFTSLRLLIEPEVTRPGNLVTRAFSGEDRESAAGAFVPVLIAGGREVAGAPFGPDGRTLAADPQVRAVGAMGESTGSLFGGALGALESALGEDGAPTRAEASLEALVLEIILDVPGKGTERQRRLLAGPEAGAEPLRFLVQSVDLLLTGGPVPVELMLAAESRAVAALSTVLRESAREPSPERMARLARRLPGDDLALLEFAWLAGIFRSALLRERWPGLAGVPLRPDLYAIHRRVGDGPGGGPETGWDLVVQGSRPVPIAAEDTLPAEAAFGWTLMANAVEHALAGGADSWSGPTMLGRAEEEGARLQLLEGAGTALPEYLPPFLRATAEQALAGGARIVLADRPLTLEGQERTGLWLHDPASGEVRFVGADGTGQATSEYSILEMVAIEAAFAVAICSSMVFLDMVKTVSGLGSCIVTETLFGVAIGALMPVFFSAARGIWAVVKSAGRATRAVAKGVAEGAAGLTKAAGAGVRRLIYGGGKIADDVPQWLRAAGLDDFRLATPTSAPMRAIDHELTESMLKAKGFSSYVDVMKASNLTWQELGELRTLARAHNSAIMFRSVNPHAYRWYREGAVGKNIFMKGKSATNGAIAGLIPEDQAFSKLYRSVESARTAEERARAWKKIADYNRKTQEAVKEGGYKFVPFKVNGEKVAIYRKGNVVRQAYSKNGKLFDAATHEPLSDGYKFVKDLRVVGKEVDGKTRYVTADLDLDAVFTGPSAPKQRIIKWQPKKGDPLGNRTPRTEGLLEGFDNLAKRRGDLPKVLHGEERFNPFPQGLGAGEWPRIYVRPDGKMGVIENQVQYWAFLRNLKVSGYQVDLPDPILKAYGWPKNWWQEMPAPIRKAFASEGGAKGALGAAGQGRISPRRRRRPGPGQGRRLPLPPRHHPRLMRQGRQAAGAGG